MKIMSIFWRTFFVTLLILFAAIGSFAVYNLTGLGPVPVRSAFAGRLPGVQEGSNRRFQFFYATNRANDDETFNERGSKLGDKVLTGTFDVLISPSMVIKPFVWFNTDLMNFAGRNELSEEEYLSKLKKAVHDSPNKSLLVIVWGFRDWFLSAALKSAYTAYVLDINTPVLLFDWPGNQGEGRNGYLAAQEVASQSAPDLGRTLATAIKNTGAEHVWLMGSSLGCQTICESFKWLSNQPDIIEGKPKLSHVVLSAPDVSAQMFDDKFAEIIQKLSKHLTAYVSSNDRALLMSHFVNGGRRLGRAAQVSLPPEEKSSEYEFEEALELLDLQAKGARMISIVDATPINMTRNLHHFFTDSPGFFDDLYQRFLQPDDFVSRRLHATRTREGVAYWILWND